MSCCVARDASAHLAPHECIPDQLRTGRQLGERLARANSTRRGQKLLAAPGHAPLDGANGSLNFYEPGMLTQARHCASEAKRAAIPMRQANGHAASDW